MLAHLIQAALGGAIGAGGRFLVNRTVMQLLGPGLPWGTLIVNVVGSALMGALVVLLAKKGGMHLAPLLMTGILGGFTTFSAFSLDAMVIYERGEVALAAAYVVASVVLSILALFAAMTTMRGILA